jgi:hypothetical protein
MNDMRSHLRRSDDGRGSETRALALERLIGRGSFVTILAISFLIFTSSFILSIMCLAGMRGRKYSTNWLIFTYNIYIYICIFTL